MIPWTEVLSQAVDFDRLTLDKTISIQKAIDDGIDLPLDFNFHLCLFDGHLSFQSAASKSFNINIILRLNCYLQRK